MGLEVKSRQEAYWDRLKEESHHFEIGEEFQAGKLKLRVVERGDNCTSKDGVQCALFYCGDDSPGLLKILGPCYGKARPDGTSIVFVEV